MRSLFLLFLSLVFFRATAQLPTVEVTVTDSVQLEPDEIIYLVSHNDDYTTVDTVVLTDDGKTVRPLPSSPTNSSLEAVRRLVAEMKLDTLAAYNYTVANTPYQQLYHPIQIRFVSLVRLREFVVRIRALENINGVIAQTKSSQEEAGQRLLYQRLMKKARAQAEVLAQPAGKKLGTVYSVREQAAEEGGGWTMYPPLSVVPGWHTTMRGEAGEKVVLQKRLVVQFNWR